MIENQDQLNRTRLAINDLESALIALKSEVFGINPQRFFLMAEPIVDQIKRLREEVDEYIGLSAAVGNEAEIWLSLQGPDIELGNTPTSIFSAMTDILRRGVQTVAEYLERGAVSVRPTANIKQACDLRIVGLAPGSVRVGLRLPEPIEVGSEDAAAADQALKALDLYLKAAEWVGSEDEISNLEREIPDNEQRRLLLSQVARLIPRPRGGVETVGLSGRRLTEKTICLRREARKRVRKAIEQTIDETPATATGTLREIDLDTRSFAVRKAKDGTETRCSIPQDADDLLDIAKEALDHQVMVWGTRRTDQTRRPVYPIQVSEIEVLDQESDEEMEPPF